MTVPFLSVVVIGRNEGARLARCLESVNAMNDPGGRVEIIYVDSASTDNSREVAARLGARVIPVTSARPTAAMGRNAGWHHSAGQYVLFLDGDTILHPTFVVQALPDFEADTAVVFGNRRETHPEASIYNRVLDLDWVSPAGRADYCGGDALICREALNQVQGYDETLIAGEEPEMCRRMRELGWKILHVDRPMTAHDLAITRWSHYWRRAVRTGYAYAEVSERFRGSRLPFWEVEARHNRRHAVAQFAMVAFALLAGLLLRSGWPFVLWLAFYLALVLRTAQNVAWKSPSASTRFLYGIHSHIQQVPIFFGQLGYWRDRRSGRVRGLIEYKEAAQ